MKTRSGSVSPYTTAMAVSIIVLLSSVFALPMVGQPSNKVDPAVMEFLENVNWDERHHVEFYGTLLNSLSEAYPKLATTYSIGHSWRERQLWCIEISSVTSSNVKAEVAVLGNIHGGEQESGESAAYVAWWLVMNYDSDPKARQILDNYVVYVVPVINPDGYENSFLYGTRSNFRPLDKDGNGYPQDDPRVDVDGDGILSRIYQGPEGTPTNELTNLGYESLDWNDDGILGNDVKESGIDLNRNFDYMWAAYDPDTDPVLGERLRTSSRGPDVASEPEVNAVQDFLSAHSGIQALASLHTGEQSVLWPWCYTADPTPDGEYMQATAEAMADAFSASTGRNYYALQSYDDYPTTAELIDFSYGRLGIYSYTVEVYASGSGTYRWNHVNPSTTTYTYVGDWYGFSDIWLRQTTGGGLPYGDQHIIVEGCLQAMIVMIDSVPR